MVWEVIARHAASEPTAAAVEAQLRAPGARGARLLPAARALGRGDAVPATAGGARQAALRHAADRVETAIAGLEEPLSRYLLELEPERAEGRSWYSGPGAGELSSGGRCSTAPACASARTGALRVYLELAVLVRALEGLAAAARMETAPDRASLWAGLFDLRETLLGSTVDDLRARGVGARSGARARAGPREPRRRDDLRRPRHDRACLPWRIVVVGSRPPSTSPFAASGSAPGETVTGATSPLRRRGANQAVARGLGSTVRCPCGSGATSTPMRHSQGSRSRGSSSPAAARTPDRRRGDRRRRRRRERDRRRSRRERGAVELGTPDAVLCQLETPRNAVTPPGSSPPGSSASTPRRRGPSRSTRTPRSSTATSSRRCRGGEARRPHARSRGRRAARGREGGRASRAAAGRGGRRTAAGDAFTACLLVSCSRNEVTRRRCVGHARRARRGIAPSARNRRCRPADELEAILGDS